MRTWHLAPRGTSISVGPGVQELLLGNFRGLPSKTGLGSPLSLYLKNAGNGESEAGGSGDQEEFGKAQTKGKNPTKEEGPEHPQE